MNVHDNIKCAAGLIFEPLRWILLNECVINRKQGVEAVSKQKGREREISEKPEIDS